MSDVPQTKEDIIKNLLLENQMYCIACEVKVNKEEDWKKHLESKKHKKIFEKEVKRLMKFWGIEDEEEKKVEEVPTSTESNLSSEVVIEPKEIPKKLSKAQKRYQKKREQIRKREEEEKKHISDMNTSRLKEIEIINKKLESEHLHIVEIPADGNCLYHAIAKQLGLTMETYNLPIAYQFVRKAAAEVMRNNIDEYIPFLEENIDIHKYIQDVESSSKWGGQLEIKAISEAYKTPIYIYSASQDVLIMGEQFKGEPLRISYHLKYLTLGNHYNTIMPL